MPIFLKKLILSGSCQISYFTGDYFNPSGLTVTVQYSNGATQVVYDYLYGPMTQLSPSDTQIMFSYTKPGMNTVTATLPITVSNPIYPTSLSLSFSSAFRIKQYYGDVLDTTGITVTVSFDNGTTSNIPINQCSISINGVYNNVLPYGSCNIVVTYSSVSSSFNLTTDYLPSRIINDSCLGDNPFLKLSNLTSLYKESVMEFNKSGHPLVVSLIYSLETFAKIHEFYSELPEHWGLSIKQLILLDNSTYKYINGEGEVLPFEAINSSCYVNKDGRYLILKILPSGYQILYPNGDVYIFNSDGYLITIVKKGLLTLNITYDASNRVDRVYYSNNVTTYLQFVYSNNLLTRIDAYSNSNYAFASSLSYSGTTNLLTSISFLGSSLQNSPLLVTSFIYSNSLLTRIVDHKTNKAVQLTISLYKLDNQSRSIPHINKIENGTFFNSVFNLDSYIETTGNPIIDNDSHLIKNVDINNHKDIIVSYDIDPFESIALSLEKVENDAYKTLELVNGIVVTLDDNYYHNAETLNGLGYYLVNHNISGNWSTAIGQLTDFEGNVSNCQLGLSCYVRLMSSSSKATAVLTVGNVKYYQPLDHHLVGIYQKVTIPFECSNINPSIYLKICNENETIIISHVSNLTLNYAQDQQLIYKDSNNTKCSLSKLSAVSFSNVNYPGYLSLEDIMFNFDNYYFDSGTTKIWFYNSGTRAKSYTNASSVAFVLFNNQSFTLSAFLNNFYIYSYQHLKVVENTFLDNKENIGLTRFVYDNTNNRISINNEQINNRNYSTYTVSETIHQTTIYDRHKRPLEETMSKTIPVDYTYAIYHRLYEYNNLGDLLSTKLVDENNNATLVEKCYSYNNNGLLLTEDNTVTGLAYSYNNHFDLSSINPRVLSNTYSSVLATIDNVSTVFSKNSYYLLTNVLFVGSSNSFISTSNVISYDYKYNVSAIKNNGQGYTFINSDNLRNTSYYYSINNVDTLIEEDIFSPDDPSCFDEDTQKSIWTINNVNYLAYRSYDDYGRLQCFYNDSMSVSSNVFTYQYTNISSSNYSNLISNISDSFAAGYHTTYSYHPNRSINEVSISCDDMSLFKKVYSLIGSLTYQIPYSSLENDKVEVFYSSMNEPLEETYVAIDNLGVDEAIICYSRDIFNRLIKKQRKSSSYNQDKDTYLYGYLESSTVKTSLINSYQYHGSFDINNNRLYKLEDTISYDSRYCIQAITSNKTIENTLACHSFSYTYDEHLRLLSSNITNKGVTTYAYDTRGLLISESNVINNITTTKTYSYTSSFFGQLSSICTSNNDEYSFLYDELGNRICKKLNNVTVASYNYYHRELRSATIGNNAYYYAYNPSGIRYKKTGPNRTTYYAYDGNRLISLRTSDNKTFVFLYDLHGVCGFRYITKDNASAVTMRTCTYVRNELGDIVSILNEDGKEIVAYDYDEWGNIIDSSYDTLDYQSQTIMQLNPFRYRGYVYDEETGLYYLNSRYYDPLTHSFLTIDNYQYLDSNSIAGVNLYCYCGYNPINLKDENGNVAVSLGLFFGLLAASYALGFASSVVSQGIKYGWENIDGWTFLQAGIDGIFAAGSMALAYTGIGILAAIGIGGASGFAQYGIDSLFHNDFEWSGALIATSIGMLGGFIGGRGAWHSKSIALKLDDVGSAGLDAIMTAHSRYGLGKGFQATLNLWGSRLDSSIARAITSNIIETFCKNFGCTIASQILLPYAKKQGGKIYAFD